jgi:hypothetical protein
MNLQRLRIRTTNWSHANKFWQLDRSAAEHSRSVFFISPVIASRENKKPSQPPRKLRLSETKHRKTLCFLLFFFPSIPWIGTV